MWLFYEKGLHKDVIIHSKESMKLRQQSLCPCCYAQLHLEVPLMHMHFIVMDLIGKFKTLPQGHQCELLTLLQIAHGVYWFLQRN